VFKEAKRNKGSDPLSHRLSERTPGDDDGEMECIHTQSDGKLHAGAWKSYKIWNKIAHWLKQTIQAEINMLLPL